MQFFTWYNNVKKSAESGNAEKIVYERKKDEVTKAWKLQNVGKRNIYNEIQEAGIGLTLSELIQKYKTQEISEVGSKNVDDNYIDTTTLPDNKIGFHTHINDLENQLQIARKKVQEQAKKAKELYENALKEQEHEKK